MCIRDGFNGSSVVTCTMQASECTNKDQGLLGLKKCDENWNVTRSVADSGTSTPDSGSNSSDSGSSTSDSGSSSSTTSSTDSPIGSRFEKAGLSYMIFICIGAFTVLDILV